MTCDEFADFTSSNNDSEIISDGDPWYDPYETPESLPDDFFDATTFWAPTRPTSPLPSFQNSPESPSNQTLSSSDSEWDETSKVAKGKGRAGDREPKHNRIKKGTGKDAKADPFDGYHFQSGYFFEVLNSMGERPPSAKLLFKLCNVLQQQERKGQPPLELRNRWAKRRIPNAYAWLDRQKNKITKEEFYDCLIKAKTL
jgi:hypothetical protein